MLLALTTTHRLATDLGFLLHKHPDRVQAFELPWSAAHVFYELEVDEVAGSRRHVALRLRASKPLVTDADSQAEAIKWWKQLTSGGGEGVVVKPETFLHRGRKGLVQPGIKCRGRDYLRIIYGPEYADPTQIDRLRARPWPEALLGDPGVRPGRGGLEAVRAG